MFRIPNSRYPHGQRQGHTSQGKALLDYPIVGPILIVLAVCLGYFNSLRGPFIFDDNEIIEPRYLRSLWPIWNVLFGAPTNTGFSGRPIVSLSLAINYALGGLNPFGYHIFNVIVHLFSALLLYGIVRRTLSTYFSHEGFGGEGPNERVPADLISHSSSLRPLHVALAIAVLWAAHPLGTEAVTYVIKRTESLMAFFYLLTLYAFIRSLSSLRTIPWKAVAVAACALGMGCKEVMATAPVVVYLYDRTFVEKSWLDPLRRRGRFYSCLAGTWILLAILVAAGPRNRTTGFSLKGLTPWSYFCTQFGVLLHYLRLALWPDALCVDYFDWPAASGLRAVAGPAIGVAALIVLTAWAVFRKPGLGFLGASFFIILSPSSSLVPIRELACEYRMYLPLACFVALCVMAAHSVLERMVRSGVLAHAHRHAVALILLMGISSALVVRTVRRNQDYRSAIAIWSDVVRQRPNNARAHLSLGIALMAQGRPDEAISQIKESVRLQPGYAMAYNDLGNALSQASRTAEAEANYRQAIVINPNYAIAHNNLGVLLAARGEHRQAIEEYSAALRVMPEWAEAHNNFAGALAALGRRDDAVAEYREAIRLKPDYANACFNLGLTLEELGRRDEAAGAYRAALRIDARHAGARRRLNAIAH